MSLDVKKISILKTEITAGIHELTISDVKLHKKSNGDVIIYEENPGIIMTFKHEDKIHQELYWIGSTNYTKLQKIIIQCGLDPAMQINKTEILGKEIIGLIKETKIMRGDEYIKSEKRLTETWIFGTSLIENQEVIEYKQEGF